MNLHFPIQLKAAILLTVFGLNTVVGFACSIGIQMGFNTKHHLAQVTNKDDQVEGKNKMHEVNDSYNDTSSGNLLMTSVHIHASGKKHIHHRTPAQNRSTPGSEEIINSQVNNRTDGKKIFQPQPPGDDKNSGSNKKIEGEKDHESGGEDDCCNNDIIQFQHLDKSVAQPYAYTSPVVFMALMSSLFYKPFLNITEGRPASKYFSRNYHPPIADIRIAIRSFQI